MRRRLAAALASALLLSGCTADRVDAPSGAGVARAGDGSSAAARVPGAATSSALSSSGPAGDGTAPDDTGPPAAPPRRACYRLPFAELARPSSDREPVRCSARHDAQTFHVGTLDLEVAGHALAVDADRVVEDMERDCDRRLDRFLGGTGEERRLARFQAVWFAPTLAQSDRGARWYRCDVVALAAPEQLHPLPAPRRLVGVLDRPAGASYGLCGTAEPGTPGFTRVICARPHSWRAVGTIDLPGGDRFPGVGAVRAAGDERCRDLVRELAGEPLRFRYGWEWPTPEQWRAGQRHGFCWAPD